MLENKIKVLTVPSDHAGVGAFRSVWPSQGLQKYRSSEFHVEINHEPNVDDIEYLKQFDIIHFHRHFGPYETSAKRFKQLQDMGIIMVMDIDDFWAPTKDHPLYQAALNERMEEKITGTLRLCDWTTTTTRIFREHMLKYNKNVFVVPNAIDIHHKMWQNEVVESPINKVRIGFCGGSSHLKDLEILKPSMNMLHNDKSLINKYQIVMCGYDVRGFITLIDENGGQQTRKIEPHETIWNQFEKLLTDNHNPNVVDEDYKNFLLKCKNVDYPNQYQKNYVRRWTLPLTQYGKHYNYMDVSLAPLVEHTFNETKSELKLIENGMKKKVLIAQDFSIHKELIIDGETGFLINKVRNQRGWYETMKRLINDPKLRLTVANNLHDYVKDKYSLEAVTNLRADFYKKIFVEKKKKMAQAESNSESISV